MTALIIGLIVFFGLHSVRVFAEPWRVRTIASMGEPRWKGLYSLVSIASLALMLWGFSMVRVGGPVVWSPPKALHAVTGVLVLVSFVLVAAGYLPGTKIKAVTGHPMTLGIKTWAFAHLLSAGSLADILLFGSFLVWSVMVYAAARRRDRVAGAPPPEGQWTRDIVAVVIGVLAWIAVVLWVHKWLVGASPFD
jgi:uncharacterized membrane protein